jgi:thiamine pyrophosphokinase
MNPQIAHQGARYYTEVFRRKRRFFYLRGGIVRGIAFIGGAGPSPSRARRRVAEAGNSTAVSAGVLIAAADSGLIAAENAGLRPDWIIGDMDSLDDPGRLEKYPPDRVLRYPQDKDYTDTELALSLLRDKGCDEFWLAGGGGGRLDHLLAIRSLFEREPCPGRWVTDAEDVFCLKAEASLSMTVPPGSLVSVFPLGTGPWWAESRGLKWPLDGLQWDRGFFGLSNVVLEGPFFLKALSGRFMIILPVNYGELNGNHY